MWQHAKMSPIDSQQEKLYDLRARRLQEYMDKARPRITASEISRRMGTSRNHISSLLARLRHKDGSEKAFGERSARAIEEALRLPAGYLDQVSDEAPLQPVRVWETLNDLPLDSHVLIPVVRVKLSAGDGVVYEREEHDGALPFSAKWLRSKNISARSNLYMCDVVGDSMEPFLMDGDKVMIDVGQKVVVDNGVYCIRYGDELRIKRLCKRFDGGLRIISDNKSYPEEVLSPEQLQHITIIGRQIYRSG